MGKIRIFELAKNMGISNKVIMQKLNEMGYEVSTHFAGLDEEQVEKIKKAFAPKQKEAPAENNTAEQPKKNIHIRRFDVPTEKPRENKNLNNRPQTDQKRRQGDGYQSQNRPQSQGQQGQNRPQGQGLQGKNRPQGQGNQGQNRPQGQGYQGQNRPQGQGYQGQNRPAATGEGQVKNNFQKPLHIPKPPVDQGGIVEKPKKPATTQKKDFYKDKKNKFTDDSPAERKLQNKFSNKKGKGKPHKTVKNEEPIPQAIPKVVIGESVTVQELAKGMGKSAAEVIKKLFALGVMATINQEIDSDTATIIASEFGAQIEVRLDKKLELIEDYEDAPEDLKPRPPVVTVMGHVDHGKTSLLDAIRETNVISTEAGGITQHIGAYQVEINDQKITFLDTPGHEAFTAMRARGAKVTDIAILVVAADDGIMPQTIEAINHSKAAKVPIIVAINKIDKPEANPERVKQELTEHGLVPEEWGGDTICVPVSAKQRIGINNLLEMILLTAEILELKANPNREARGTVIEAQLDKGRGPVATMLIHKGTLKIGDTVVVGTTSGKVRAMNDDKGRKVKSAGPSTPVEVLGLSDVPPAGEIFIAVEDEKTAKHIAESRLNKLREEEMRKNKKVSLDDLFKQIAEGEVKDLNVIIKADVQGSVEAIRQSLEKISNAEVRVNVIHGGVGTITESDVMLAAASNAIIIGFNVRPDAATRKAAENEEVDIRLYRVIYDAIDDIKAAMSGLLAPTFKEVILGRAEVRQVFKVPKAGMVAGCLVTEGKVTRSAELRIIRDGIVIHEGKLDSLKRFKDDVKEVTAGYECGIGVEKYNDIKIGDIIEAFEMEEVKREI